MVEKSDKMHGWEANKRVACCGDWNIRLGQDLLSVKADEDEELTN